MTMTKEEKLAQKKAYYRANREKIVAAKRAYTAANKEALRSRNRAWREANREHLQAYAEANRERANERGRKYASRFRKNNRDKVMLLNARRSGRECNLELCDIVIPTHCPVLGIELDPAGGPKAPNLPSLDRIDSRKGYVKGNVRVISWRANRIKTDMSIGEALALYEYMLDHLQGGAHEASPATASTTAEVNHG